MLLHNMSRMDGTPKSSEESHVSAKSIAEEQPAPTATPFKICQNHPILCSLKVQ